MGGTTGWCCCGWGQCRCDSKQTVSVALAPGQVLVALAGLAAGGLHAALLLLHLLEELPDLGALLAAALGHLKLVLLQPHPVGQQPLLLQEQARSEFAVLEAPLVQSALVELVDHVGDLLLDLLLVAGLLDDFGHEAVELGELLDVLELCEAEVDHLLALPLLPQVLVVVHLVLALVDHHAHRHGHAGGGGEVQVALGLAQLLREQVHAVAVQQDAADVHLRGHHLGLDHLPLLQPVLLEQPLLPLRVLPDHEEEVVDQQLHEEADHEERLGVQGGDLQVELAGVELEAEELLLEVVVVEGEGGGQVADGQLARQPVQRPRLQRPRHLPQQHQQEHLQVAQVDLVVLDLPVLLADDQLRRLRLRHPPHLLLLPRPLHLLRNPVVVYLRKVLRRQVDQPVVVVPRPQVLPAVRLETPTGETRRVARQQQLVPHRNHRHPELADLGEVVHLLALPLLAGRQGLRGERGRRGVVGGVGGRVVGVVGVGGGGGGEVEDLGLVAGAAAVLLAAALLGHHHHALHVHEVLVLQLHEGTHRLVLLLLRRRQAPLELQLLYPVLHPANFLHQLRLLAVEGGGGEGRQPEGGVVADGHGRVVELPLLLEVPLVPAPPQGLAHPLLHLPQLLPHRPPLQLPRQEGQLLGAPLCAQPALGGGEEGDGGEAGVVWGGLEVRGEGVVGEDGVQVALPVFSAHGNGSLFKSDYRQRWMHPLRSKAEPVSSLSREGVVERHQRQVRLSFLDLAPYVREEFGFIDPDFPHVAASLSENEAGGEGVEWLPAEELHPQPSYSDRITNLESSLFSSKAISHALILINWFANAAFSDIFLAELSPQRLYEFEVMVEGVFLHLPIDSYVPVTPQKKELFTPNYQGSIFPCLYEKLMAKVYGDYQSITSEFIDIVELQTFYCRQELPLTRPHQQHLLALIQDKLEQKSIVAFRTRNSIRLESFGLESNHVYIILRVVGGLVEFLELEGEKWIGKHSKLRSSWLLEGELVEERQIIRGEEYKENYMSVGDMQGMGRHLIILNNTQQHHKNYYVSHNTHAYFTLLRIVLQRSNKCMMRTNFRHKRCYNALYLVAKHPTHYSLKQTAFAENKDSLYLESELPPGEYFVVVYNTHPQEEILPFNYTLFTSEQFVDIQPINNSNDTLHILQQAFLKHFLEQQPAKDALICKQMYAATGLAFIFIQTQNELTIRIDQALLEERKIYCINSKPIDSLLVLSVPPGQPALLIFRCLWSKKENIDFEQESLNSKEEVEKIVFPPPGSVKLSQKIRK